MVVIEAEEMLEEVSTMLVSCQSMSPTTGAPERVQVIIWREAVYVHVWVVPTCRARKIWDLYVGQRLLQKSDTCITQHISI
jgi:hypothetical protein